MPLPQAGSMPHKRFRYRFKSNCLRMPDVSGRILQSFAAEDSSGIVEQLGSVYDFLGDFRQLSAVGARLGPQRF